MTWFKDLMALTLLLAILFGATLGQHPLEVPDGARYAEIPREMVVSGDYLTPHLNGLKYFEKPPLFYWIQAGSIKLIGVNELAANLPNALLALLCCLIVYATTRKLFDRTSAFCATLILATSTLFFVMSQIPTLDMALTAWLTAALGCFIGGVKTEESDPARRKFYMWLMWAFLGLAVMTKGLAGLILPALIIFIWMLWFRDWKNIKAYCLFSGPLILLAIALPWHLLVQLKNPEFFNFYFIEQHFLRYLTPYAGRAQAWWFFPAVLIGGFYPWILFLGQSIKHAFSQVNPNHKSLMFLLLWAGIIYTFYSFSDSKLIPYLLPAFPALAIITGHYFASLWQYKYQFGTTLGFNLLLFANIILGAAGIVVTHFNNNLLLATSMVSTAQWFICGTLLLGCGLIALMIYRKHGVRMGFLVLTCLFSLFLININTMIPTLQNKSIKPLALILKAKLQPQDEVVSYKNYYQDLPFYLERTITVAEYKGELAFGSKYQEHAERWMIDAKTFWERWQNPKRMFMLTDVVNYEKLDQLPQVHAKMHVIARDARNVLVTNQP
jgi:4-amino-4-deoxy-L-arabinose transferase-like glycosyltransferase